MFAFFPHLYRKLAQILRRVIDIHRRDEQVPVLSKEEKVYLTLPIFRAPIVIACILPGDYYYLHVRKPGRKTWDKMTSRDNFYVSSIWRNYLKRELKRC